jgi:hypothetical protein
MIQNILMLAGSKGLKFAVLHKFADRGCGWWFGTSDAAK